MTTNIKLKVPVANSVNRTVLDKLSESISVKDFGAVGDGIADDTVVIQAAIDTCAALGKELIFDGTFLVGRLSTAVGKIRWTGKSNAKLIQKPGTYTPGPLVTLNGDNIHIRDILIDGQQSNLSAGQGCTSLLGLTGKSPTMQNVSLVHSVGVGLSLYSQNSALTGSTTAGYKQGYFSNCHFDDNVGLGIETIQASYHTFENCTFDRNGYGFHLTRANYADNSHGFTAFGMALRFRSHHFTFIGGTARDNGRDGANVNQGSYSIKFSQFLCHGNDDGGFTIASDQTNSGLPGEAEACYDIEYINCESYNNYSDGLAVYQPAHNVTVIGGRYYNNNRVAGTAVTQSSFYSGIYFAAGCTGIKVDAKCYDDRQYRAITAVSGSTLTATSWIAGSMLYYPAVAFYNSANAFQGYGRITAESAGSVTVKTMPNSGVTLANITAGWFITQAVQHNGVFVDNSCVGSIACDGYGHRLGPAAYTGRNVVAGYFSNNTNIILPKERAGQELLLNPGFESDITNWNFYNPPGGNVLYHTGAFRRSAGSVQLVGGTSAATQGDAGQISGAAYFFTGEFLEFGGWVYAVNAGDGAIYVYTRGSSFYSAVSHPGGGWKYLKIGLQVAPDDTGGIVPRIQANPGKTCYFDSMSLRAIESHVDSRETNPTSRYLPL